MKSPNKKTISILMLVILLSFTLINTNYADSINDNIVEYKKEKYIENDIYESNKDESKRVFIELEKAPLIFYENILEKPSIFDSKKREINNYQQRFKNNISRQFMDVEFLDSYDTLVNGFSCMASNETIDSMKINPLVKNIYILNEIERPSEEYSIVNIDGIRKLANRTEDYGGSGTIISIIDTGFDPFHEAMKVSDSVGVKITEDDVNRMRNENNLLGKYFSEKIPYGYNYFDKNNEIRDLGYKSEHGMHVAGIAVGNSENFKGQAPDAQLLAMKVFSNNPSFPSTFEDIYIKAIEDSIKIGADVINLSLGTPAGFNFENSILAKVIKTATDSGIICTTSAGNVGQFLYGKGYPYFNDPDVGTVGSPSIISDTFSVGANYIEEGTGNIRMAEFSSWGVGPLLEMKPEIAAPGVEVLSTLGNNKYGIMSGTSMASPYVAGNMAKLKKHIDDRYFFSSGDKKEVAELSKAVAMNTANIIYDKDNQPYSPRVQGSGFIDMASALNFNTTVVDRNSGLAKVELRDFDATNFHIPLRLKNYSQRDMKYNTKVYVLVNEMEEEDMETSYNLLKLKPLESAIVDGPNEVEILGNSSKDMDFYIDFTDSVDEYGDPIPINQFIEGFVVFEPMDQDYPEISIPYTGFYGDWLGENSPRIFDGMDKFGEKSVFSSSGFIDNNKDYIGHIPGQGYLKSQERIAISPGTDSEIKSLVPVVSYLRNVEEVQFNIVDENQRVLRRLTTDRYIRKNYYNRGNNATNIVNPYSQWDGKINNKIVKDGIYYYEIKGKLQGSNIWQEKRYPVIVDTKLPDIDNLTYEDGKIKWSAFDFGSGLSHFYIYGDGENILGKEKVYAARRENGDFQYEYNGEIHDNIKIIAIDCAGNKSEKTLIIAEDNDSPEIYITRPEMFDIFSESEILIEGYVLEKSQLNSITIDGEKVDFYYNYSKMRYEFSHLLNIPNDGVQNIIVAAEDEWGNKMDYRIIFYVNTSDPNLEVENPEVYIYMPGGGKTIVVEDKAYSMKYFKTLSNLDELLSNEDVYIKLSDGIFIDKNGFVVSIEEISKIEYYYTEKFRAIYSEEDGKLQSIHTTIKVGDNLGIFTVYVNGSEYYAYDEGGIVELNPVLQELNLDIPIYYDMDEIIIEVVDMAGNTTTEIIMLKYEE